MYGRSLKLERRIGTQGKIGDHSIYLIGIALDEAKIIVSGNPLVCTYSESEDSFDNTPSVGFKGMRHEHDGWAFASRWSLFEEIKEETKEAREAKMVNLKSARSIITRVHRVVPLILLRIGISRGRCQYIVMEGR